MGKRIWKTLLRIVLILLMIFSALFIIAFFMREKIQSFFYFPGAYIDTIGQDRFFNESLPSDWEKLEFQVDGKKNFGVFVDNEEVETIYFFHGNGGDLRYFQEAISIFWDFWYNILALEYPWYGEAEGYPTEENIMQSAEILYSLAKEEHGLQDEEILVWGYSIGSWIASRFAVEKNFSTLILESPFTSWYDLAEDRLGFVPQKAFGLENNFDTTQDLDSYSGAVLIVHGEDDNIVPANHTEELQEALDDNVDAIIDPVWDHFNLLDNEENLSKIAYFLENNDFDETGYKVEEKRKDFLDGANYDIYTDSSVMKYVDPNVPYNVLEYIPSDMRKLSSEHIIDGKWDLQLRDEAAASMEYMAAAFYKYFWEKILTVSSYRSYAYQAGIKARWCPDTLCAKAGHSEHQWGLAIDLWEASTSYEWEQNTTLSKYYDWLSRNAHYYGWHNPYTNGVEIDGYEKEPWHWRYLGVELASYLYEQEISFSQYYDVRQKALGN